LSNPTITKKITANLQSKGQAIEYDYTRLRGIRYPEHTENNVTYTYGAPGALYNRANRIVTIQDESGSQELFYDYLGEVIKNIRTIASDTQGNSANSPEIYTTEWLYDTWGRLHQLTYPDLEILTNKYDSGGLLNEIYGDKGGTSTNGNGKANNNQPSSASHYAYLNRLEYDKFDQRVFIEYGNKISSSYAYDPRRRWLVNLQAGQSQGQGSQFQDLAYDYDKVGNILGLANRAEDKAPSQMGGATQFKYQYDDLYRLVKAEGTFDYKPNKQHQYTLDMTYDSIHRILRKNQFHQVRQPSGTLITQKKTTHDLTYQYQIKQPHAASTILDGGDWIGDKQYAFDLNGNQLGWEHLENGTNRTIGWDEENRIQSIADNGHTMTYKYDHAGNRVIKQGPQGETAYVNQWFTIRNREVGTKHVYAGSTRVCSKLMKQDKPGSNPNGNQPFEKDTYFYHPDHLGSSAYVTDSKGDLYQHLEYFPFGETFVEEVSNTQRTPYWFTAKELDEEIDAYYFGARYYDQVTAGWFSTDPADRTMPSKSSMGLNLYQYSVWNPIRFIDPDGQLEYDIHNDRFIVQSGDTLNSIAQDTGFTTNQLMSINPQIKNRNMIYAEQSINIPDNIRMKTFRNAAQSIGDTNYARDTRIRSQAGHRYGNGWKCNIFVGDMTLKAGGEFPLRDNSIGWRTDQYISSDTLADQNMMQLENLSLVGREDALPGDSVSFSGTGIMAHTTIYTGNIEINGVRNATIGAGEYSVNLKSIDSIENDKTHNPGVFRRYQE